MRYVFGIFVVLALITIGENVRRTRQSLDIVDRKLNQIEFSLSQIDGKLRRMELQP